MFGRLAKQPERILSRSMFLVALIVGFAAVGLGLGATVNNLLERASQNIGADETSRPAAGARVDPPYQVQDFTLTSHTGDPVSLSDLRKKAVLMFFGYSHCPDICPTTLADYRRTKLALGETANEVAFVFITVDGQRDTPDVLAQYLVQFDADFIGMTGDPLLTRQIGAEYGLMFDQVASDVGVEHQHEHNQDDDLDNANYFVQHTSPSFLIDPDGYLRMVYFYGTEPEVIVEGVREILQSRIETEVF